MEASELTMEKFTTPGIPEVGENHGHCEGTGMNTRVEIHRSVY